MPDSSYGQTRCVLLRAVLGGASLLVIALWLATAAAARTSQGKVTVIGDSVADWMEHSPSALESLSNGFEVDLQTRGCRRLVAPSCVIVGSDGPAPTTLEVVKHLGHQLGNTVVVDVGYNDTPSHYNHALDTVMRALQHAGVKTVIWLTLRDPHHDYRLSNTDIEIEHKEWPQLVVADWNTYSAGHPAWFQPDGIHLTTLGAAKLGAFIHRALVRDTTA
jgi:hypothetical protein